MWHTDADSDVTTRVTGRPELADTFNGWLPSLSTPSANGANVIVWSCATGAM